MTPPPEPRTAAGRLLVDTISEYQGEPDDGQWARRILAIEAEAADAPLPPLDAHDTHTPCCAIPAEHKWADPIRCLKDHENWPCRAALTATPAPAPLGVEEFRQWVIDELASERGEVRMPVDRIVERYRLTARAAATDHEGFSPTPPGNTHWKRTPLARAAATENE